MAVACTSRRHELVLIRQAMAMTLEVHRQAAMLLRPGITTGEVRRFIDEAHRALGADGGSTFCAVQFGVATAYPHGLPGDQVLQADDLVLIDTGCHRRWLPLRHHAHLCLRSAGSLRRPRPGHHERDAQQAAFDAVRPGVPCEEIDAVAQDVRFRAMAMVRPIDCRDCRIAPATVSACRSTSRPISCRVTRARWRAACVSATNR